MNPFSCGTISHDVLASRGFGNNCDKKEPERKRRKHSHVITIDAEELRKFFNQEKEAD